MTPWTLVRTAALGLCLCGPALAEPLAPTGGAGNTGVAPPTRGPGELPEVGGPISRPSPAIPGNPSPASVPGSTPGLNIGGTPTSGPPGTGGAAGGPSIGNQ